MSAQSNTRKPATRTSPGHRPAPTSQTGVARKLAVAGAVVAVLLAPLDPLA